VFLWLDGEMTFTSHEYEERDASLAATCIFKNTFKQLRLFSCARKGEGASRFDFFQSGCGRAG
jgi:hypothetical protein